MVIFQSFLNRNAIQKLSQTVDKCGLKGHIEYPRKDNTGEDNYKSLSLMNLNPNISNDNLEHRGWCFGIKGPCAHREHLRNREKTEGGGEKAEKSSVES